MSEPVELFGADYSVYVRICRIALAEKGVDYTLHPVDIFADGGPPGTYRELNPFGRIPSLRHGTFELYETDAITAYVDEAFNGPYLMPADIRGRARARQIMRLADTEIYKHLVWGVYVPWKDRGAMPGLGRADLILGELQQLSGDSWLAGGQVSLADVYVYPMLAYFSLVPEGAAKLTQFARLALWMEQMRELNSVVFSRFSEEKLMAGSL
ncbi:MAG: glutathione S-transferase family protein [Pseudomonadota bacterium]